MSSSSNRTKLELQRAGQGAWVKSATRCQTGQNRTVAGGGAVDEDAERNFPPPSPTIPPALPPPIPIHFSLSPSPSHRAPPFLILSLSIIFALIIEPVLDAASRAPRQFTSKARLFFLWQGELRFQLSPCLQPGTNRLPSSTEQRTNNQKRKGVVNREIAATISFQRISASTLSSSPNVSRAELSFQYYQNPPPSSPPLSPEHEYSSLRQPPSPHPEIAPALIGGRERSWSRSSSNKTVSSFRQPPRGRESSQSQSNYYSAASVNSRESFGAQPEILRSEASGSFSRATGRRSLEGNPGRGILSSLLSVRRSTDSFAENTGHHKVQRRYTEDWVLHRGYQQHRRTSENWNSESSQDSPVDSDTEEELGNSVTGPHHSRNISNAKTVTPADFEHIPGSFLSVPGSIDLSSDNGTGFSGVTGVTDSKYRYRTAPQSLVEVEIEPPMPTLPSRWAATPSSDEGPMDMPFPLTNGLTIKTSEPPNGVEEQIITTAANGVNGTTPITANGTVANYLLSAQKPLSSRSNSPNPKNAIKWGNRKVYIQIPDVDSRPIPITIKEVEEKLEMFRQQGYNVDTIGEELQNREVYPEEQKGMKIDASDIFVSIPDKRDWEAYVTALREEKLRALGVLPDDEPPTPSPSTGPREHVQTPMSNMASPALHHVGPMFSPPPQTGSAMSNPHGGPNGPFNPFSPISIPHGTPGPAAMPSPIGAAPNHAFAFHLPRQSVSMTGTPDLNGYDNPYGVYPPPGPPQHTHSPSMAGSGIWSPPYGGMRNGSPGMMGMGMHGHSASQFNAGYPPEPLMDPYAPHHGLVGQERYHQHQIRRGSPLAHVNHNIYAIQDEVVSHDGPAIDAPVPKHRHQLSVTLQKEFDNSENYQSDGSRNVANGHPLKPEDDEAFATNPVSPAPAHYPEQPEMPNVETDVHNGPELTSDPEDDISNDKVEKQKNIQQAHDRQKSLEFISAPYNTDQNVQLQMPDIQPDFQQYMPHTQYALPHSREQSLSQRQHEYDSTDPIQNSAMSMLLAGEGLGGSNHHLGDELLSEDGRTNISDIVTNPSEPPSPKRKFSTTTSHAHGLSNNSNTWNSDHNRNVPSSTSSTTKPKFNVNASEFKFDPSKTFSFKPQNAPTSSVPEAQGVPTRFGGFGAPGFNVSAAAFQPSISTTGTAGSLFEKGAAAFSAHAPAFTPSYAKKAVPEPASDPIFAEIVKPPTVKKVIPIVSPIIPQEVREDTPSMESMDRREDPAEGGRKRTKHSPRPSFQENFEEPQFETPEGDNEPELPMLYIDQEEQEENIVEPEQEINDSSDEGEKLIQTPLSEIDTGANGLGLEPFGANVVLPPDEVGDFEPLGAEVVSLPEEAEISEIQTEDQSPEPSQKFNFRPDAPAFGLRATAEEFNFEFPKPASPPKVFGGMSESRYAHTPSPPPTHPAPPPPVLNPGTSFLPPQESTDYDDDNAGPEKTNAFGEPMSMPMPTDAELDEVIRNLDHVDPTYIEQEGTEVDSIKDQEEEEDVSAEEQEPAVAEKLDLPWKRDSPKRMTIPNFEGPTPNKHLQGLRSAGPSPSPRRVAPFIRHRASSFSPDDDEPELPMHAISGSYNSQDIGIAKDDNSDWDDMISDDENKLRPQSRLFFDAHVEELVGGLFQRRLEPVLRALTSIDNNISSLSSVQQPKNMTDMVHSDADDEEDSDVIVQARSPRDRKLDKFKAAVAEVLLSQNGAGISQQSLEELIAVNKNLGSDIAELPSVLADTISSNSPKSEDMAIVRASLEDLASRVAESTEVTEIRTILGDGLATLVQSKDIRVAFSSTAQKTDITEIKTLIDEVIYRMARAEDFSEVKRALTSLNSNAVQHADLEEVTRTTRDVLKNGAKRQDVDNVMQVINESLTRKEDLVPIHRLLGDGFQNSAKTEDLKEMNQCLMGVKDSVLEIDVKSAHQDIIKISNDTVHISNTLQQLWALAEQHRDQIGFNLGRAQEMHQIGQDNALHISASLKEFRELWNSKATKSDMRRSLVEKEQKSDVNELKGLVSKALGNTMTIQEGLRELSRTQPTLVDFRSIVESLADMHPKVEEFRHVFKALVDEDRQQKSDLFSKTASEIVQNIPSLHDFKALMDEDREQKSQLFRKTVGEVVQNVPSLHDFKALVDEDREQKSQLFRNTVSEVVQNVPSLHDFKALVDEDREQKSQLFRNTVSEVVQNVPSLHDFKALVDQDREQKTQLFRKTVGEVVQNIPSLHDFKALVDEDRQQKSDLFTKTVSEVVQNIPSLESFKSIVEEAVSKAPGIDDFRKVIQEDRNQKSEQFDTAVQPTIQDIRSMMEDVIAKQQIFVPLNFDSKATDDELEALRKKVASLEASSAQCKKQAEEEAQSKREWQEKAIELETKLKIVQENADKDRADWQEKETGFQVQGEKDRQALVSSRMRCSLLAGTRASLQESQRELEIKISSLESSLEENRMKTISLETSLHESKESEERTSTLNKQLEDENRTLRRSIETLRAELEESIRVREGFRTKFDKVQDNIRRISSDIGQEQAKWKTTNDEQLCRIEVLEASVNAEATKNEFLESEVKRLEKEEKESIRLRVEIDSMERAAAKSDQLIAQLRQDALEDQTRAAHLAREVDSAREAARTEINQVTAAMSREIDAANSELNTLRDSLEKELEQARYALDQFTREASIQNEKMISRLEEETNAKNAALKDVETERTLKKAAESANAALKDELHNKEREAKEAKRSHERSMRFAKEDHERSVKFAKENDSFLEQKLKNAESNADHLREMIASLTENFKIANSAAQAAAQAAATASQANGTNSDDRALRESVDVLQSQLQERETRIEQLESQLSSIDRPAVKQVQGQLNMYRDILEVRIDDLNEIIHMCKMPNADLAAIHDAATRLQASLEMQRQSGERTTGISNGGNSPTLSVASGARIGAAVWRGVGEKFAWRGGRTSGNTTPTPPATAQRFGGRFGRGSPQQTPIPRSSVSAAPPQFRYDADADAEGSVLSGGETETE